MVSSRKNSYIIGSIALATTIGVLSTFLRGRRHQEGWMNDSLERTKSLINNNQLIQSSKDMLDQYLLMGGIAGAVVGITTALLLAPKSGKELVHDVSSFLQPNRLFSRIRPSHPYAGRAKPHPRREIPEPVRASARNVKAKAATRSVKRAAAPLKRTATHQRKDHSQPTSRRSHR